MIISLQIDPNNVLTYHETGKEPTDKVADIKSRDEYTALKASVLTDGVKDPILVRVEKGRTYVEVGEQRVLAARELGIKALAAIAYNFKDAPIELKGDSLKTIKDVEALFPRKEYDETVSGICSECGHDKGAVTRTVTVPALDTIRKYIEAGIAKF